MVFLYINNTNKDTQGCILVSVNNHKGTDTKSTETFTRLYERLLEDPDDIMIEIR